LVAQEFDVGPHVCPWWGGYFIDNRLRRWLHNPERILAAYVEPGMTALDFGCGMGMFSIALANMVGQQGQVIAADLQQQMLDVLLQRAERAGVAERIRTHRCQSDSMGLDPSVQSVQFALAFYSAHEALDLPRLLDELFHCLHPGGRFLVVEPVGHVTADDFANMMGLAQQVGFRELERPRVRLSRAAVLEKS
jgi:ubiquinone/menaquinone biosynthesis C-methylase UbiE